MNRLLATIGLTVLMMFGMQTHAAAAASTAERPTPPDLPATAMARQAIDEDFQVIEARRVLDASKHGAAALRASPHEWTAKLSAQRRSVDTRGTTNEWTAGVERTIRVGGKATIDRDLGDIELEIALARISEARHEAARKLATLWVEAQAATRRRDLWAAQLSFADTSLRAVEIRQRAGDASALDVNIARGDRFEVQRQLSAAVTAETKATETLAVRFPALKFEAKPLNEPTAIDMTRAEWRERIVSESDPVRMATGLLKKAELTAARSRADRIPDLTLGLYTSSEAFRSERVIGVSVSIPLSGTYRSERMLQSLQEVEAARARLERQRRDTETEIVEAYVEATGGLERWRLAAQGLTTTQESARLTQRAYTLGEADLQTLLQARRQALEATTAAEQARVEALRWQHRLLIDAHLIWGLADE